MTEHDPKAPDDRELEEFLSGRSPLSRAYKEGAPQDAAPPELDAPVLAAAREELRRARPRRRLLRWDGPLALAASMFLVLGLGVLVWRQVPPPGSPAPMRNGQVLDETGAAAPAPVAAAPPAALATAPEQAAEADTRAPPAEQRLQKKAEAPARLKEKQSPVPVQAVAVDKDLPAAASGPQPVEIQQTEKPSALNAAQARDNLDRRQAAADQAQPPAEPFPAAPKAAPAKPSAFAAEASRDAYAEREEAKSLAESPAAAPAPASPPPPPPLTMNAPAMGTAPAGAGAQIEGAPGVRGMMRAADACDSPQRMPAQRRDRPETRLDAAAWLEQIRGLRGAADFAAVRVELACFRARYPQAALPDDLKDLAPR